MSEKKGCTFVREEPYNTLEMVQVLVEAAKQASAYYKENKIL